MEGEGGPTATDTASPSLSPPHEPNFSPVGSPDETVSDLPPLPSDDDHDHGPNQSAGTGGLTDDLKHKIIKQVVTLNNEQDWRNGMRVKLLKRMGKYGQKKQSRRAADSEKNYSSRFSDRMGDEENHNSIEHHDDTPDEEDGDQLHKEKNGHRGRNRGRGGRQKHRGTNGHGHGTTWSSHAHEPSKPPPGPRMPDGTRGFTMGRGRPPNSNQS